MGNLGLQIFLPITIIAVIFGGLITYDYMDQASMDKRHSGGRKTKVSRKQKQYKKQTKRKN